MRVLASFLFCMAVQGMGMFPVLAQSELHMAVARNDELGVKQLLDAGADINGTMKGGVTALMVGAKYGRVELCRLLLDKGARVNQSNAEGNTALMMAVTAGRAKVVQLLLSRKADLTVKNRDGMDAKELAELLGYENILKLLS